MNIRDIARLAGVSASTVSRAMNEPHRVRPDTLERIQEIIREHNYRSNPFARNIINQKTKNIVMVVPALNNNYIIDLADSIRHHLNEHGFMLNLMCSSRSSYYQDSIIRFLADKAQHMYMDGLVVAGSTSVEPEGIRCLEQIGNVPLVIAENLNLPEKLKIDTVYVDEEAGIGLAMERLKLGGYKTLGVLTSRKAYAFTERRMEVIRKKSRELGLSIDESLVVEGDTASIETSVAAAGSLFSGRLPDAVYAFNDITAMAVMKHAVKNGLAVPRELGIICGESSGLCSLAEPSITGVVPPTSDMGRQIVRLLMARIGSPGRPTEHLLLPAGLSAGGTC